MWLNKRSLRHKSENFSRGSKVSKIWCSSWVFRQYFCLCRALFLWFILFCWVSLHLIACSYFSWNWGISNKNLQRFYRLLLWAGLILALQWKRRAGIEINKTENEEISSAGTKHFYWPPHIPENVYCSACELISCSAWQTTFQNKVSQIKTFF